MTSTGPTRASWSTSRSSPVTALAVIPTITAAAPARSRGFVSLKAGTTAKVVEHDVDVATYVRELEASLQRTGFLEICGPKLIMEVAAEVFATVKELPAGTIIGNRGRDGIKVRRPANQPA